MIIQDIVKQYNRHNLAIRSEKRDSLSLRRKFNV